MSDNLFEKKGTFFRGNLHTHSDHSDGVLAAEEVCRRYKANGYDFIALTDHFIGRFSFPITDTRSFRHNGQVDESVEQLINLILGLKPG